MVIIIHTIVAPSDMVFTTNIIIVLEDTLVSHRGYSMKEKWAFEENDMEFLQDIARMEMGLVAQKWAKKLKWEPQKAENNARGWLHRIRQRVTRCQNYVNKIRALQKQSPRIRKLTTSGKLPEEEEEET
jgi:hypothetical protein